MVFDASYEFNLRRLLHLASCDSEMEDFLRRKGVKDILYPVDRKCGIFSIPELVEGECLKYVVWSRGNGLPERLDEELQKIVLRGLGAQIKVQGLEGVQVLRKGGFYENIVGLLGPFEYLEGCNLSHIDDRALRDPENVLRLFKEFDENLRGIHGRRIIHGDVKPGNLVYNKGRLVLIDWSTSRTFEEDWNFLGGKVVCTLRYYYPLFDRSLDYWGLSLTLVDVLGEGIEFSDRTIRDRSDDFVGFLAFKLNRKFGKGFAEFYRSLANRPPEYAREDEADLVRVDERAILMDDTAVAIGRARGRTTVVV